MVDLLNLKKYQCMFLLSQRVRCLEPLLGGYGRLYVLSKSDSSWLHQGCQGCLKVSFAGEPANTAIQQQGSPEPCVPESSCVASGISYQLNSHK